jgi:signal peptidase I
MMAGLAKVMGAAATTVLVIVVLAIVALCVSPLLVSHNPTRPAFIGDYSPLIVLGGSMEPTYHIGSILFVRRADPESIRVGDIITFTSPGTDPARGKTLTTHRVTSVGHASGQLVFHTKGDANNSADVWTVPASTVVGRGTFAVPYVGYASSFARSRVGFVLLVIVPGLILILMEIVSIIRQVRGAKAPVPAGEMRLP